MSNIEINYIWDQKLALESAKILYDYELKNSNKKYLGWFFIALLQFGVVGALKHNAYGLLSISTILVVYWYNFRWPIRKYFIKKTFLKSPFANKKIKLVATDKYLQIDENSQIQYNDIKKYEQLDKGIFLDYQSGTIFLPNKAFSIVEDKNRFYKFISLNCV